MLLRPGERAGDKYQCRDEAADVAEVEWGGEGYEEDPGSGALPNPF